jgi:hypothetical protein
MSRILIAAVLIGAVAAPAHGQFYSLWADESRTTAEFWTTSPYQTFTIYVFLDPGSDGAFGAEYKMAGPPGHFSTGSSMAPFVSDAVIGQPYGSPGVSVGFTSCQNDTVWLFAVSCMASNVDPGVYTIEENDNSRICGVVTCIEPGRPIVEGKIFNSFCYNTDDGSHEDATWGAIKKQY